MTPPSPSDVKSIFGRALELDDPDRRAAFLDEVCAGAPAIRAEVEELLGMHERAGGFLRRPAAVEPELTGVYEPPPTLVGTMIAGKYKLLQQIGEGGMGTVWMADQTDPVKRRVAVKLIRLERGQSKTVLSRFEAERQAIALMDHPHIARMLDAGTTDGGQPFFAMELVKGVPLDEFCDAHRLDIPGRLEIFKQICSAVQHAHQKGIIHRDLKPSNILVESHDGKPVPKVIDFGLAKATTGLRLTEQTMFTGFGSVMGTPCYMAPEQAAFNAMDVDTRADIYTLGVILYELLTGTTPLSRETIKKAALEEMVRLIREQEAPTPSSRLSSSDNAPSVAANRQSDPVKLGRFVRGELDWIVLKALAKERDRRYETANGFAQDIERFLNHEPVTAGPPSARYRFKKFVQRNRGQVIAASLVLFALIAGIAGTTWGLIEAKRSAEAERVAKLDAKEKQGEAERQTQIADAVREFLQKKLLGQADIRFQADAMLAAGKPAAQAKRNPTILELLDRAAEELTEQKIEQNFPGQPLVQAEILRTVGNVYLAIGENDKATQFLRRSAELRLEKLGPDHPDTLLSQNDLGWAEVQAGFYRRGIPRLNGTLEKRKVVLGPDHPDTLTGMERLAFAMIMNLEPNQALPIAKEVFLRREMTLGANHRDTFESMRKLAEVHRSARNPGQALPLAEKALELQKKHLGEGHPDILSSMTTLAMVYEDLLEIDKSKLLLEKAFERAKEIYGIDAPETLQQMSLYHDALPFVFAPGAKVPSPDPRCVTIAAEALNLARGRFGTGNSATIPFLEGLADAHIKLEEYQKALPFLKEALEVAQNHFDSDDSRMLSVQYSYANGLYKAGEHEKAIQRFEQVRDRTRRKFGPDSQYTITVTEGLAEAYYMANQKDKYQIEIERVFDWHEERLKLCKQELGPDHLDVLRNLEELGFLYLRHRSPVRAVPHLRDAFNIRNRNPGPDLAVTNLGDLYPFGCLQAGLSMRVTGRPEVAAVFLEEAVDVLKQIDANHPELTSYQLTLASAYAVTGQLDKAMKFMRGSEAVFRTAVELTWLGRDREVADIVVALLKAAQESTDPVVCDRAAKACCLGPADPTQLAVALKLAQKAMETNGKNSNAFRLTLGMVQYNNGNLDDADKTLKDLTNQLKDTRITGTAAYYMAMIRFKEGKQDEARKLATATAAKMTPIPEDIEHQLAWDANLGDMILWLTYKRAKKLIGFKNPPPPKPPTEKGSKSP